MEHIASSFRDPSGFVFSSEGRVYRQVNQCAAEHFEQFLDSGLYEALVRKGWLVSHQDVTASIAYPSSSCYMILCPEQIPYISYPYEWSFSQLKDAAMLTLKIQALAMKFGFCLKDASSFNIQFIGCRPVLIDTLSFEPYEADQPWVAYRQFCQHFLAPLALMAKEDISLGRMLQCHIDGIPLNLASKLLPFSTRFDYRMQAHIHLHARMQDRHADSGAGEDSRRRTGGKVTEKGLRAIIESLAQTVDKLRWKSERTEWGDYYDQTNYENDSFKGKRDLVDGYLGSIPEDILVVQDLGANTGVFSRVAALHSQTVVSQDIDPLAVERNYRFCKDNAVKNILPLVQDLTAPSPSIGWGNEERDSFLQRSGCDVVLALALVHHLAISNNTPLHNIAKLFSGVGRWLVIEFVPKSDSQVIRLLATRDDIFPEYNELGFEKYFSKFFSIIEKKQVPSSDRTLYLMKSRAP